MKRGLTSLLFVFFIALPWACNMGSKDKDAGGSDTNTGGSIAGGTTGTPINGGNGNNSFPTGPSLAPTSSYIHYIGRQQTSTPGGVRLSWPGSAVQVRVTNASRITATLQENQLGEINVVGVLVDGTLTQKFTLTDNSNTFVVNVPTGDHIVTLVKRTEAGNGQVLLANLTTDGQFEIMPTPTNRLIEIIGEDTAAGYSSDGADGQLTCPATVNFVADPNTQNAAVTFGAQTAKAFNADYSIMAYSGRGLIQNSDGSQAITVADIYDRLDPRDYNSVVTGNPNAQVVIINVGANDINAWMRQTMGASINIDGFVAAYVNLIKKARTLNPSASIIVTAGPTLGNSQCIGANPNDYACGANGTTKEKNGLLNVLTSAVQTAVTQASQAGVQQVQFVTLSVPSGNFTACYQPSAQGHAAIAQQLIPIIAQATGWQANAAANAAPKAAEKGTGPKELTGNFTPWQNPLTNPNSAFEQITNKEFPQCHYCSPMPYNATFVGTSSCPSLVGTLQPCQSYCHIPTGFAEVYPSNPPTSSNHYSTPAVNNAPFTSPKPRGNYIHSLEHGAIVLAYNCPNNSCPDDVATLNNIFSNRNAQQGAAFTATNNAWIILTPDPFLSTKFAIMAWTFLYTPDTLDTNAINCFIDQHKFYGRECLPKGVASGCSALKDKPMGSIEG